MPPTMLAAQPDPATQTHSTYWLGFWRLVDPKITLASVSSILLGAAAAAHVGPIYWGWLLLTLAGILSIELGKHASGEIFDFNSGADLAVRPEDRTPFSGGKRVLVDSLLTQRQAAVIAAVAYVLGILCGLTLVVFRDPMILLFGIAGMALAWCYHAPPIKLAYRGFGELAVGLAYGPLICCGTYVVQRRSLSLEAALVSIPLGLLIAGFLWVNQFPDYHGDLAVGKRNLVVRLGKVRAGYAMVGIVAAAFLIQLLLPLFKLPHAVWIGMVALPFSILAVRRVRGAPDHTASIISAQRWMLECFLIESIATSIGMLISIRT
jgi:1,4-dihydroxy-2-naphthoate octaprenyltransferase